MIFLSGDDGDAKSEVGALFEDADFFVIDLGGLREGGRDAAGRRPTGRPQPDSSPVSQTSWEATRVAG